MATTHNDHLSGTLTYEHQSDHIDIRPEADDPTIPVLVSPLRPTISTNPHHQIRFRHPHYPDSSNVLLMLFAPDTPAGGIEYGVAHAACGVISGNRWNGWFTKAPATARLNFTYGDILCERDYYFHLPESSFESPYPVVPTFKEWAFPHDNLHPCWQANSDHAPLAQSRFAAPSSLSAAVFSRDQSCRMSAYTEGTQAAHLCPRSEEAWFHRNEMSRYNLNPLLIATGPTEDTANALLLRQDLHAHFDSHKFVFVPKKRRAEEEITLVTHLLIPSRELGIIHHNRRVKPIPDVDIAFVFARFAWTMFTLLAGFLKVGVGRTLIGTTISIHPGVPRIFTAAECRQFISGPKARSQSPTKGLRRRSDDVDVDIEESERHHKRQKKYDLTTVISQASQDTKTVEEITTPTATGNESLRGNWLIAERLRSDPQNKWLDEVAWARRIRDGSRVMDSTDVARLYKFWGHEERDLELDKGDG